MSLLNLVSSFHTRGKERITTETTKVATIPFHKIFTEKILLVGFHLPQSKHKIIDGSNKT